MGIHCYVFTSKTSTPAQLESRKIKHTIKIHLQQRQGVSRDESHLILRTQQHGIGGGLRLTSGLRSASLLRVNKCLISNINSHNNNAANYSVSDYMELQIARRARLLLVSWDAIVKITRTHAGWLADWRTLPTTAHIHANTRNFSKRESGRMLRWRDVYCTYRERCVCASMCKTCKLAALK